MATSRVARCRTEPHNTGSRAPVLGDDCGPPRDGETFDEYIRRRRDGFGFSNSDVWRRGGASPGWSKQQVNNMMNGDVQSPGEDMLERMAQALETTPNVLRPLLGRRRHGKPFVLPASASGLSDGERRILLDVMDGFLGKYKEDKLPRPRTPRQRKLRSVEKPRDLLAERDAPGDAPQRAAWTGEPGEKKDEDDDRS